MAKNETRRLTSAVLGADREAFDALQGITTYAPANQAYKTETIRATRERMDDAMLLPPETEEHRRIMKEIARLRVYADAKRWLAGSTKQNT